MRAEYPRTIHKKHFEWFFNSRLSMYSACNTLKVEPFEQKNFP